MARTAIAAAMVLVGVLVWLAGAGSAYGQAYGQTGAGPRAQDYDRRVDLSTQPFYAPFGQMPQDYRDGPSLYSSGNVRYGRAFTGNRNFLEDRYFDSSMTRFYRDSTSAYDIYGGGRQYAGSQPYFQPGSIVTRGDTLGTTGMQRADPFGIARTPPPAMADPIELERGLYPGAAVRPYGYVAPPGVDVTGREAAGVGPNFWSPRTPMDNVLDIESQIAAQAAAAELLSRGPFGTPLPMQWRAEPADPEEAAGVAEGAMPNPWILLPEEVRQTLTLEEFEREREQSPVFRPGYFDEQEVEGAPGWLQDRMRGPSLRDRLIEAMRDGEGLEGRGEGAILDPQSAIPYGGPARAGEMGERALRVGRINMQVGLYRQAIEQFERAAMLDMSVREEARRLEGHARLLSRSDRLAALMVSESIMRTPAFYGREFRLSQIVDNAAVWEQTLAYTGAMVEQLPDVPMYQFLHGYVLHGLGRQEAGRGYLEKVSAGGSGFAEAAKVLLGAE